MEVEELARRLNCSWEERKKKKFLEMLAITQEKIA
jgi:hypothetical protein